MINKKILFIFIFIILFILFFPYIFGSISWIQTYKMYKYGHPRPYNYVGMSRSEIFKWIDNNRVFASWRKSDIGKISIGIGDSMGFYDNLNEVLTQTSPDGNKIYITHDKLIINYAFCFNIQLYYIVILQNDVVVSQKLSGTCEMLSFDFLFPYRSGNYGNKQF